MWPCSYVENIIDWNRGFRIYGWFNGLLICCNLFHIDVEFESIGGLESIKQALYELVIRPLRKPELFSHGKLLGPQRGYCYMDLSDNGSKVVLCEHS
jgi:hypothetical protein